MYDENFRRESALELIKWTSPRNVPGKLLMQKIHIDFWFSLGSIYIKIKNVESDARNECCCLLWTCANAFPSCAPFLFIHLYVTYTYQLLRKLKKRFELFKTNVWFTVSTTSCTAAAEAAVCHCSVRNEAVHCVSATHARAVFYLAINQMRD